MSRAKPSWVRDALSRRSVLAASAALAMPWRDASAALPPVKIMAPAAPSGATDVLALFFAQYLSEDSGRSFVVENGAGAACVIGTQAVARAPADGTSLLMASVSHAINPALIDKIPYDSTLDFAPVAKLLNFSSVLITHPSVPVTNLKEFIAHAKAHPDALSFALGAVGSSQHLAGLALARDAGIKFVTVPYKGASPAMNDLLGGHVSFMIQGIPVAQPHIRSGAVRALGVTGLKRFPGLAEVPTLSEAGLPGYDVDAWLALLGPAGLPEEFAQELHDRLHKILARPDVVARLLAMGVQADLRGPAETKLFLHREADRWTALIRESGIKPSSI